MIEINNEKLEFSFPHVHEKATCSIDFQRTLRIPDDNNEYPLPPGLGQFPLHHVDDFTKKLPKSWDDHGGVFLPMYQAEALWINFDASYPCAVKIAAGKINAITGDDWNSGVLEESQDYAVIPEQPWLDGFNVSEGLIRQFVAMPLGSGYTAEEQMTGSAVHGGLQIVVYPMKRSAYIEKFKREVPIKPECIAIPSMCIANNFEMGMAPGGLMRQQTEEDPYGLDVWDQENGLRLFVHLANSELYENVTGNVLPQKPVGVSDYTKAGLPWFEHYTDFPAVTGSGKLIDLDSVAVATVKKGDGVLGDNISVSPTVVKKTGHTGSVRSGKF